LKNSYTAENDARNEIARLKSTLSGTEEKIIKNELAISSLQNKELEQTLRLTIEELDAKKKVFLLHLTDLQFELLLNKLQDILRKTQAAFLKLREVRGNQYQPATFDRNEVNLMATVVNETEDMIKTSCFTILKLSEELKKYDQETEQALSLHQTNAQMKAAKQTLKK
jgi:hypothetical protein